jgi:hypothetical protein
MNRDKPDTTTPSFQVLSVFRGIYKRVADHLDIDPSYVSRVARGERNAPYVSDALRKEIQLVLGKVGLRNGDGKNHDHSNGTLAALLDGNHANGNGHAGLQRSNSRHGNSAAPEKQAQARARKNSPARRTRQG